MIKIINIELSNASKNEINSWLKKFPSEHKRSAIMPALTIVQKENGGALTRELISAVAAYLAVAEAFVYEVATFYDMYTLDKVGKYNIAVCTNVSCLICGCNKIVTYLKHKFGIEFGEITADGKFMLTEAQCLGACDGAPAIQINSKCYKSLTLEELDIILEGLE